MKIFKSSTKIFKAMVYCFFVFLLIQDANAQKISIINAKKVYLSSHMPMWTATINMKTKTFTSITNKGKSVIKNVVLINRKDGNFILFTSKDGKLEIKLYQTKNCDCIYDIPEKEASKWNAEIVINKKKITACAYW